MAGIIDQVRKSLEDPVYKARKSVMHVVGKAGIKGSSEFIAMLIPSALVAEEFMRVSLVAAPAAAVLSSGLVYMDHLRRKDRLLDQYRPQLSAWLSEQMGIQKSPEQLNDVDLDFAAYGDPRRGIKPNAALNETVEQSAKERNWGIAISVLSSVLSTVVVGMLMHTPLHDAFRGHDITQFNDVINIGARALIGGAVGFAMYLPISFGLHWVAEHMFGLEKETANDHIKHMKRELEEGRAVTQEQVLEAFVKAHPDLDHAITEMFGKRFFNMRDAEQQRVLDIIGPQLDLARVTLELNARRMQPEALAFVLEGREINLNPPQQRSGSETIAPAKEPQYAAVALQSPDGKAQAAAEAYTEEKPEKKTSFVRMVGRKQQENATHSFSESVGRREVVQPNGSYTEVVEQTRTEVQQLS